MKHRTNRALQLETLAASMQALTADAAEQVRGGFEAMEHQAGTATTCFSSTYKTSSGQTVKVSGCVTTYPR